MEQLQTASVDKTTKIPVYIDCARLTLTPVD
ncbi:hypothetical protein SAMN06297251_103296 [Fulvimarina manganoxydans]|uniref:Uncharacterized protein n=1 Tax=Fulvimarina manganoxydans TaxID=937218 RepID=A0A1W2A1I4_9HYPH|nr:hypothetical protein SAMN06297251_103296 [Fulvimarina manganoxydans]